MSTKKKKRTKSSEEIPVSEKECLRLFKATCDSRVVLRKLPTDDTPLIDALLGVPREQVAVFIPTLDELVAYCKNARDIHGTPKCDEFRLCEHEGGIFPLPVGLSSFASGNLSELSVEQLATQARIKKYLADEVENFTVGMGTIEPNVGQMCIIEKPSAEQQLKWFYTFFIENHALPKPGDIVMHEYQHVMYPFAAGAFSESLDA